MYFDPIDMKQRCKDPAFCFVCYRNREDMKVDKHHVCMECRTGTPGMPRRLPTVTLDNGKTYFIDERLKQLRNVLNPCDYIDF